MTTKHYDYIAIGGGSGGIASINRAAVPRHEGREADDAGEKLLDLDMLVGGVAVADIARRAIDGRHAEPVDEERRFRPERRALYRAAPGHRIRDRRAKQRHFR